jgi:hypothetical protein
LARSRPSPVRARISSRSNSASPPSTVSIKRPCGVVVSAHASPSDRNPAPTFAIVSRGQDTKVHFMPLSCERIGNA